MSDRPTDRPTPRYKSYGLNDGKGIHVRRPVYLCQLVGVYLLGLILTGRDEVAGSCIFVILRIWLIKHTRLKPPPNLN